MRVGKSVLIQKGGRLLVLIGALGLLLSLFLPWGRQATKCPPGTPDSRLAPYPCEENDLSGRGTMAADMLLWSGVALFVSGVALVTPDRHFHLPARYVAAIAGALAVVVVARWFLQPVWSNYLGSFSRPIGLSYGPFIALGSAVVACLSPLLMRDSAPSS